MDNGPGWFADPEDEAQERYWNGSTWTDRVRPVARSRSLRLPDHVPELQRALAASTADIDAVEDRLSTMFDRTDGAAPPPARPSAAPAGRPREDRDVYADADSEAAAEVNMSDDHVQGTQPVTDWADPSDEDGGDDEAFAELNAALASEEPDEADAPNKRGLFRRRP